jgi:hypothetical protein
VSGARWPRAVAIVRQAIADGMQPRDLADTLAVKIARVHAWVKGGPRKPGDPRADDITRAVLRLTARRCAACRQAWTPCETCKAAQGNDNAAVVAGRPRKPRKPREGWGNTKCPVCFAIRCSRHEDAP